MPRRIAIQVSQLISRQLRGGLLKSTPVAFQTLVDHPPTPLPSRAPVKRSEFDTPSSRGLSWNFEDSAEGIKEKGKRRKGPKLGPQPIVYLEDRIRERFYNDHPWETLNPRLLVEGSTINDRSVPDPDATDLTAWGRNPSPDDVIACVVHLHRRHGLSLSQAYHNTLSSYHALRAEHEHASRIALFEARAYGAKFSTVQGISGEPTTSAVEIARGFKKESEELLKGARFIGKALGNSFGRLSVESDQRSSSRKYRFRVRPTWAPNSQGSKYLEAALAARDGTTKSSSTNVSSPSSLGKPTISSSNEQEREGPSIGLDPNRANGLNNSVQHERILVGQS